MNYDYSTVFIEPLYHFSVWQWVTQDWENIWGFWRRDSVKWNDGEKFKVLVQYINCLLYLCVGWYRSSVKWWIGSRRYSLHVYPSFSFLCGMDLCFQETLDYIRWVIVSYPIILILCYLRMFDNVGRLGGYWFLCSMTGRNYIRRCYCMLCCTV